VLPFFAAARGWPWPRSARWSLLGLYAFARRQPGRGWSWRCCACLLAPGWSSSICNTGSSFFALRYILYALPIYLMSPRPACLPSAARSAGGGARAGGALYGLGLALLLFFKFSAWRSITRCPRTIGAGLGVFFSP